MERLRRQLKEWLPVQFPGMEVALNPKRAGVKISGIVAWKGFEGMEPIDRQSLLRHALRDEFSQEEYLRVSLLVALTPAEHAVHREPQLV